MTRERGGNGIYDVKRNERNPKISSGYTNAITIVDFQWDQHVNCLALQ